MFRLIFLTFHDKRRYDEHKVHVHESPRTMLVPLMILAVLSIIGGGLPRRPMLGTGPITSQSFCSRFLAGPKQRVLKGRRGAWNSPWRVSP